MIPLAAAGVSIWTAISVAIATGIGVIVSTATLIADSRRTRRALGIDNMWKLIEKWDQQETVGLRASRGARDP